jgi:uncharacterized protein (TIGR02118 family)
MLKRITLLARREDLSFEQFSTHWLTTHAEIVRRMPMVHGYVQNPVERRLLEGLNPTDPFAFDGIVELWFADQAAQDTAFASEAAPMLPLDEKNFIRGITIFAVREDRRAEPGPLKVICALRPGAGAAGEAAADALAQQLGALPGARLVTVNHLGAPGWRKDLWHEPHPPQALIELGFADAQAAHDFAGLPALAALHAGVSGEGGALECYLVRPRRII